MSFANSLLLIAALFARDTNTLPDLQAPPQGEVQWIAREMRLNGLPMTLKSFQTHLTPDALFNHYESQLKMQTVHEAHRSMNSPWSLLTLSSSRYLITIQARDTATGSEGTILVSPPIKQSSMRLKTGFPRPPTTRIVNLQQYDDSGVQAEHISLSSHRAPFVELRAFSQLLLREGWSIVDARPAQTPRGYVLQVQRQTEHAMLVLMPDAAQPSTTAIVIAWRRS